MTEAGGAPPIAIAPFAPGDENGVLGLILAIQNGEFGIPISADQQPDLRAIPQFYQSGAGGFWVARCGLDIVGTIGLKDIGNAEGALRKMFVAAAFRGAAFAVAPRLLRTLLDHAVRSGTRRIFLGTTDKFRAAHRFYEKHGFATIAKAALPATFPLMAVDTKFYAIELPPESSKRR